MEWRRRERLEGLVQSIKTLQVGITTDEEVRALSERYGGRFAPEGTFTEPQTSTYSLEFSSPCIKRADGLHTLPGRRLWIAGVELVMRDRRLVRTNVRFMVIRSDGYVLMSGVDVAQRGPSYRAEWASYEVSEPHYTGDPIEGLKVLLSPEATTAERETRRFASISRVSRHCGNVGIRVTSCRTRGTICALGIPERDGIQWMRIAALQHDSDARQLNFFHSKSCDIQLDPR